MNDAASITVVSRPSFAKAVVVGAILCGTGDLLFAFFHYGAKGATPLSIMQTVAGGVLGRATFQGGAASAALGFALHYLIALILAAIYCASARRIPLLLRHAALCGLVYGAVVYYVMNMVVVPFSAYQKPMLPPPSDPWALLAHAVLVGLPIALAARRFLPKNP